MQTKRNKNINKNAPKVLILLPHYIFENKNTQKCSCMVSCLYYILYMAMSYYVIYFKLSRYGE